MKDIDTLEAEFKAELVAALRRAVRGRSRAMFSLTESRAGSSARKLRTKAERIIELRKHYSVDHSTQSPAASYLLACLRWEHGSEMERHSAQKVAEKLLREVDTHAT